MRKQNMSVQTNYETEKALLNSRSPRMNSDFNRDSVIIDKYRQKA